MPIQRIIIDVAMLDGAEYPGLTVITADRMKLAETARRHKWGGLGDETDGDRSITFLAYCAMTRLGHFTGTWAEFIDRCETVTAPEVAEVDPTRTNTPAG